MPKLQVRTRQDSGVQHHHRAGIDFSPAWQIVEVDDATATALHESAILEVKELVDSKPEPPLTDKKPPETPPAA